MQSVQAIATGCRNAALYKILLLFNLIEAVFGKLDIECSFREHLRTVLESRGAQVSYVECYRRERPATDPRATREALGRGEVHAVHAMSAESVENFAMIVGPDADLARVALVVPHEAVARTPARARFGSAIVAGAGPDGLARGPRASRQEGMTTQPNDPLPALPPPSPARPARATSDTLARGGLALALVVAAVAAFLAWDARQSLSSLQQSAGGRLADLGGAHPSVLFCTHL